MNPVAPNINTNPTNCGSVISSNCVTYQGTLPECISYCAGDSLTDVINSIATVICNTVSADGLQSQIDGLQAQIDALPDPSTPPSVNDVFVPVCITFLNQLEPILNATSVSDALQYTMDAFCTWYNEAEPEIEQLKSDVISLQDSLLLLPSSILQQAEAYTDAQIALNNQCTQVQVDQNGWLGNTPGGLICVSDAVSYFAARVNDWRNVIGDIPCINTANAALDSNLYTLPVLDPALTGTLGDNGVVSVAATLCDSVNSIWVTLQDLRAGFVDFLASGLPCILVPVQDLQTTNIGTTSVSLSWSAHGLATIEAEDEYSVEIFAYDGVQATGPVLVAAYNLTSTASTLSTTGLDFNQQYIVRVTAHYSCGIAVKEILTYVNTCAITYKAILTLGTITDQADTCLAVGYTRKTARQYTVQLKNPSNQVVNNLTGSDMNFTVRIPVVSPLVTGLVYEEYTFTIPQNQNTVTRTDLPDSYFKEDVGGNCEVWARELFVQTEGFPSEPAASITNDEGYCFVDPIYTP
jgi:hypothetical protein